MTWTWFLIITFQRSPPCFAHALQADSLLTSLLACSRQAAVLRSADMQIMHMHGQHAWPACLISYAFCLLLRSAARLLPHLGQSCTAGCQPCGMPPCRHGWLSCAPRNTTKRMHSGSPNRRCPTTPASDVLGPWQALQRLPLALAYAGPSCLLQGMRCRTGAGAGRMCPS
jgi:hypothetical protein